MVTQIKGNLFNTSCKVIVNTVNCEGIMGKGIALEMKLRFPEMYQKYKEVCDQGLFKPGTLQLWKNSKPWVLNFPTKVSWKNPSEWEYLKLGLEKFATIYKEKEITSIAFPLLGASNGGLEPVDVKKFMIEYLEKLSDIDVEIYQFDPNAEDNLFTVFYQKVRRFSLEDYKKHLNIKSNAAENLKQALDSGSVKSMLGLQDVQGLGEKAMNNIHEFVKLNPDIEISSQSEFFSKMSLSSWRENKLNECKDFPSHLYFFAKKDNFESICKHGLLSKREVRKRRIPHTSFAEQEVQFKRSIAKIYRTGDKTQNYDIHDFVPLYFTSKTPTLYARKDNQFNFFFLKINSKKLITNENIQFAFCDGNAASDHTLFFYDLAKLHFIDWRVIHANYWNDIEDGKRKRNAEFLIFNSISLEFVDEFIIYDDRNHDMFAKYKDLYKIKANINVDQKYFF